MGLDPRTDPARDEDWLRRTMAMPDPDRREAAIERLAARVLSDRAWKNRRGGGNPHSFRFAGRELGELLTKRQKEVLTCASHGLGAEETADALGIGIETVRSHLLKARLRLRASTKEHAVAQAIRGGMIE